MQNKGFVLGTDFTLENAVCTANNIRFEELTNQAIVLGGVYSFNGDDNCEDCTGWDGKSHRCNCGNRRVDWSYDGNFENMYVFGEAY